METFRKLKPYYWPYKKYFFVSLLFLLLVTSITVVYPMILQLTIDEAVLNGMYEWIPYLSLGLVGFMVIKGISSFIQQYFGDLFGIRSVYELRNGLYEKLQYLPFRYYDRAKTGDLMSRLTADVEGFRFFLSFGITELLRLVLLVTASFIVMLYYSVSLTFVTFITLPFLAVAVYKFDRSVHPAFRGVRKAFGRLNTNVQENISGIQTVKSLSREGFQIEKFNSSNGKYKENYLHTASVWAKYFPLMEFIGNMSVVILLGYGGYLVINNQLKPGELVAFYSLVWYIIWPIMNLGFTINLFSQAKASGERLLEILEENEDIKDQADAVDVAHIKGDVKFDHVTFTYPNASEPSLQNVSFTAYPGKIIGLIGATGSGKSSIIQLLLRFYEPEKGAIFIDDRPIHEYQLQSLRKHIGIVLQETFLFSSSIKANIAYGRPEATMDEIIDAAKRAQAHDFIMELPDGYDTLLGERGLGLSGGQKQRIAIARALCTDPSILILDDATSAVDMTTEKKIQQALQEVMKGRTTFIVAHRISSVQHADEILVLDEGRIVERGVHDTLKQNGGIYQRIFEIQYQDQHHYVHAN
ncbi:ABC transporter ATP-binding protein [Aeribacillus pallidus]|jgi:ATP-binding cassette, subfamily B, multidrug efflux pump|uniref:ABC transporter ATP-binding protein n=1 Tax=Aeribacillus pallidus TaxID=33936 RepID=UPI001D91A476|nr:ABC transporter ATP-binding protein [Bacillus sp. (in: firmicutes)]